MTELLAVVKLYVESCNIAQTMQASSGELSTWMSTDAQIKIAEEQLERLKKQRRCEHARDELIEWSKRQGA